MSSQFYRPSNAPIPRRDYRAARAGRRPLTRAEIEDAYLTYVVGDREPDLMCVHPMLYDRLMRLFDVAIYGGRQEPRKDGWAMRYNKAVIRPFRFIGRDEILFTCRGRTLGSAVVGIIA
jgi:hypothetical protein